MSQIARIMAWLMLFKATVFVDTAVAEPYVTHTDLELRVGEDALCGSCDPHRYRTSIQVFVDRLFPIRRMGYGVIEIGPYVKGALLDGGHVPQIAGGVIGGYRYGRYELLVNVGLAYATAQIGSLGSEDSSQTRTTYDLGLSLRCDINRLYLSVGYKHNSNGEDFGLNFSGKKEQNPGIDGVFVGVGIRF